MNIDLSCLFKLCATLKTTAPTANFQIPHIYSTSKVFRSSYYLIKSHSLCMCGGPPLHKLLQSPLVRSVPHDFAPIKKKKKVRSELSVPPLFLWRGFLPSPPLSLISSVPLHVKRPVSPSHCTYLPIPRRSSAHPGER